MEDFNLKRAIELTKESLDFGMCYDTKYYDGKIPKRMEAIVNDGVIDSSLILPFSRIPNKTSQKQHKKKNYAIVFIPSKATKNNNSPSVERIEKIANSSREDMQILFMLNRNSDLYDDFQQNNETPIMLRHNLAIGKTQELTPNNAREKIGTHFLNTELGNIESFYLGEREKIDPAFYKYSNPSTLAYGIEEVRRFNSQEKFFPFCRQMGFTTNNPIFPKRLFICDMKYTRRKVN